MDVLTLFSDLNEALSIQSHTEHLYICGGAALLALGVISRETQDVDVLAPLLDAKVLIAARSIAKKHGLGEHWINNQVERLAERLPKNWMKRSSEIFRGSHLIVSCLHREDLIASKLLATCDRDQDFPDLIALKPSRTELKRASLWVKAQKKTHGWPHIVDEYTRRVEEEVEDENSL